jgi:hypothetical protein
LSRAIIRRSLSRKKEDAINRGQKAEAPFNLNLPFVPFEHLFGGELVFAQLIGRHNEETFSLEKLGLPLL